MSAEIKVHFIDKMGNDLTVVNAARISFLRNGRLILPDGSLTEQVFTEKDAKLVDYLAKNEHMSPFEHCSLTLLIECPLYIRSQIHRHRTFAYNEVSRRYTADDLEFYIPPVDDVRAQSKSNKQASDGPIEEHQAQEARNAMKVACSYALEYFNQLIAAGVSREQARGILPQCLMTKFYMTGNLRNWAHFVRLRDHSHAQKEAQYIAREIKTIMREKFPEATAALFRHSDRATAG